jgi:hypothetical protein
MRACSSCPGLIPAHLTACPHCAAAPGRWTRLGRALTGALGAGAAMMTLAACYGAPAQIDTCPDVDGDGWFPACYADDGVCDPDDLNCDCDDADPTIHPGALDPADGVDRDCDGKDGQRPGGPTPDAAEVLPDAWPQDDAAAPPDAGAPLPDAAAAQ